MSRKKQRVPVRLNTGSIKDLIPEEIKVILRGADEIIARGGRTLLSKILKGSQEKKVLELCLNQNPVYGYYKEFSNDEIMARIDWAISNDYFSIEYDGRLPVIVYTEKGWEIERETYAKELLQGFNRMLESGDKQYDKQYLKDRNRGLIFLLLNLVESSGKKEYIPILEAWERIDYKKVRQQIQKVIQKLQGKGV